MKQRVEKCVLVAVYEDKASFFHGCCDSSLCNLGILLVRQIFNLLHENRGDFKAACDLWGSLLRKSQRKPEWNNNSMDAFDTSCEEIFEDLFLLNYFERRSSTELEGRTPLEFFNSLGCYTSCLVEINLDHMFICYHFRSEPWRTEAQNIGWHFKQIYIMFITAKMRERFMPIWLYSYEELCDDSELDPWKFPYHFELHYLAVLVQRQFRRFSAYRKLLEPGGVFFLQAKKRFEVEANINIDSSDICDIQLDSTRTDGAFDKCPKLQLVAADTSNLNHSVHLKGIRTVRHWCEGSYGERTWGDWRNSFNYDKTLTLQFVLDSRNRNSIIAATEAVVLISKLTSNCSDGDIVDIGEVAVSGTCQKECVLCGGEEFFAAWLKCYHLQVENEQTKSGYLREGEETHLMWCADDEKLRVRCTWQQQKQQNENKTAEKSTEKKTWKRRVWDCVASFM